MGAECPGSPVPRCLELGVSPAPPGHCVPVGPSPPALAGLEELEANYEKGEVSVKTAETNLGYTKILAPMDGTVYGVVVEAGASVEYAIVGENAVIHAGAKVGGSPAPGEEKSITTIGPDLEIPAGSTVKVGAMISSVEEV